MLSDSERGPECTDPTDKLYLQKRVVETVMYRPNGKVEASQAVETLEIETAPKPKEQKDEDWFLINRGMYPP